MGNGTVPPPARVVDRPGWVRAAAESMADLTGSDRSGRWLGKPAGAQAGAMLAYLASAILGQYDPFTGDGTLLLVAPNVVAVERALKVPTSRLPPVGVSARGHPPCAVLAGSLDGGLMRESVAELDGSGRRADR